MTKQSLHHEHHQSELSCDSVQYYFFTVLPIFTHFVSTGQNAQFHYHVPDREYQTRVSVHSQFQDDVDCLFSALCLFIAVFASFPRVYFQCSFC